MRLSIVAIFSFMNFWMGVEVGYVKPIEIGSGGFLEQDDKYILQCTPRHSLFMTIPGEMLEYSRSFDNVCSEETMKKYGINAWVYKNLHKGNLLQFATSIQNNPYLIDDILHPMQWEIKEEVRALNGIPVKKACCTYRGRYYTAWFAPSIPYPHGPWKLGGLPGLILEAYDDKWEVVFNFQSIKPLFEDVIIKPKSKGRKIAWATYQQLNANECKQLLDLIEARLKKSGSDFDFDIAIGHFSPWEYLE